MVDLLGKRPTMSDAREAVVATLGADPFVALEELRQAGHRKARAEGIAYAIEHQRKILLATISNELAVIHAKENLSEAKLDRMARADQRYADFIKGAAAGIEERELAASEYWRIQAELTWCEKTLAHANSLMRLGG